jgi:mono/diheme cytochrome c family protein
VWISEPFLNNNDSAIIDEVAKLQDDASYDVRVQVLLSMYGSKASKAKEIVNSILVKNGSNEMIVAVKDALDKNEMIKELSVRLGSMAEKDKQAIMNGALTFRSLCANCHGADGNGLAIGGNAMAAPPLAGALPLHFTEKNKAIRILLNGLTGPVNGKNYSGGMPSMAENSNRWIADVLSYARYQFGNMPRDKKSSPIVTSKEVGEVKKQLAGRNTPWTLDELKSIK